MWRRHYSSGFNIVRFMGNTAPSDSAGNHNWYRSVQFPDNTPFTARKFAVTPDFKPRWLSLKPIWLYLCWILVCSTYKWYRRDSLTCPPPSSLCPSPPFCAPPIRTIAPLTTSKYQNTIDEYLFSEANWILDFFPPNISIWKINTFKLFVFHGHIIVTTCSSLR